MQPVQGNVQWEAESKRTVQVRDVNIPPEGKGLEEKKDCTCPCKVPPAPWMSPHTRTPQTPNSGPQGLLHQAAFEGCKGWRTGEYETV